MFTQASRAAVANFLATDPKYGALLENSPGFAAAQPSGVLAGAGGAIRTAKIAGALTTELKAGGEIAKYYTLNSTGNILISSTVAEEEKLSQDVKETFQKVIVFFGAWTAALDREGKTLYDYDAISSIISGSGLFVKLHQEDRDFSYSSTDVTLDTAIIASVLSGFAAMEGAAALSIAQTVVGNMGSKLRFYVQKQDESKKIGHLLFICENLMGMPIVSASLLYTSVTESKSMTQSNCHKTVSQKVNMQYHQETFMFVDPAFINKFAPGLEGTPEYEALIEKFARHIKTQEPAA